MQNQEIANLKIKQLVFLFSRKMKQITKYKIYLRHKKKERGPIFIKRRITNNLDLFHRGFEKRRKG